MEIALPALPPALWRGFVDLVTPSLCLSCACRWGAGEPVRRLLGRLQLIEEPVCDVLGTPFAYDQGEGRCLPRRWPTRPPGTARAPPCCLRTRPRGSSMP